MVINSIIAFVLAALSSAIFAPMTIKLAFRVGAIDIPKDSRKIHAKPMPRIGGLSFILAFFIAVLFGYKAINKITNNKIMSIIGVMYAFSIWINTSEGGSFVEVFALPFLFIGIYKS